MPHGANKTKLRKKALGNTPTRAQSQSRIVKQYMNETGNLPPHGGGSQKLYDAWLKKKGLKK